MLLSWGVLEARPLVLICLTRQHSVAFPVVVFSLLTPSRAGSGQFGPSTERGFSEPECGVTFE